MSIFERKPLHCFIRHSIIVCYFLHTLGDTHLIMVTPLIDLYSVGGYRKQTSSYIENIKKKFKKTDY